MTHRNQNDRKGNRFSKNKFSREKSARNQHRNKRVRFGVPRRSQRLIKPNFAASFAPPEDWHEPIETSDGYRVITQEPGAGFRHVVNADEIEKRLAELPGWMIDQLDVIQLSRMTRKKLRLPCYGMQWGTTLYLYPIEESMEEVFVQPPSPALKIETEMYGGKWKQNHDQWCLRWTETAIKDYYLNNILIHELGHLLDERNTSYTDRERYAEWFAIEYGYLPTRNRRKKRSVKRRHHST